MYSVFYVHKIFFLNISFTFRLVLCGLTATTYLMQLLDLAAASRVAMAGMAAKKVGLAFTVTHLLVIQVVLSWSIDFH